MDDTDFDFLCEGLSAGEAKRLRKIFREWCDGDENDFPVQLALLTRAQWRMAASVPRSLHDGRKWLELHLADYRQQTNATVNGFCRTAVTQTEELKTVVGNHAKAITQAANRINVQLADAEAVAQHVKALMESAASEWKRIMTSTTAERERLEKVAKDLDDRFAWRQVLWGAFWFSLTFGFGLLLGLYAQAR